MVWMKNGLQPSVLRDHKMQEVSIVSETTRHRKKGRLSVVEHYSGKRDDTTVMRT